MKVVKFLIKAVLWLVVLLVVALLALPLWFGPVVKTAANIAVPKVTQTGFNLGHIYLNPYIARFELRDVQLSNPEGYSEKMAVTLGELTFDAETMSLATDVIHIEELTVKDVFVSVVDGGVNKVGNFKQIQYNVAGGKEKYEAAEAAKKEKAELDALQAKETAEAKREPAETAEAAPKPEKKVIIDKLHISGLKIRLGILPISIPVKIELADIGRKSGGATLVEAWQQVWEAILKSAGAVGDQLKALGGLAGDMTRQGAAAVNKAAAQATEAVGAVTDAASKATESVGAVAGSATKAVSGAASKATEGATKAVEGTTKAVSGAASKATEGATKAVEGATKALDSLKSLW